VCLQKTCKNGGSCTVIEKESNKSDLEAYCRCADGFTGESCEKKLPDRK
jgi:hypothetical protein